MKIGLKSEESLHRQHLRWALQFCQMDLNERTEYLEDIKIKLYEFIRDSNLQAPGRHFRAVLPEAKVYVGELTNDHVKQIYQAFKEGFSGLSDQAFIVSTSATGAPVSFYLGALTPSSRFFQSIVIHSDPVSQSAAALELHLVRSGLSGEQIRKCPECSTIFITERRGQMYCSTRCAHAVGNREYYQREKEAFIKAEVRFRTPEASPSPQKTPAIKARRPMGVKKKNKNEQ